MFQKYNEKHSWLSNSRRLRSFLVIFCQVCSGRHCWFAYRAPSVRRVCSIMDYSPFAIHSQHCCAISCPSRPTRYEQIFSAWYILKAFHAIWFTIGKFLTKIWHDPICVRSDIWYSVLKVGHQINLRLPTVGLIRWKLNFGGFSKKERFFMPPLS